MHPELAKLKARHVPDEVVSAASNFLDTGDPSIPRQIKGVNPGWEARLVGNALFEDTLWSERARRLVRFFTHLAEGSPPAVVGCMEYLLGILRYVHEEAHAVNPSIAAEVVEEIESTHGDLDRIIHYHLEGTGNGMDWRLAGDPAAQDPFISPVANFILRRITPVYARMPQILTAHDGLFRALALQRPEVTRAWCEASPGIDAWVVTFPWRAIIDASDAYDTLALAFCEAVVKDEPVRAFRVLRHLDEARDGLHAAKLKDVSAHPHVALGHGGLAYLLEKRNEDVIAIMTKAFAMPRAKDYISCFEGPEYKSLFELMIRSWESGGRELLRVLVPGVGRYSLPFLLKSGLKTLQPEHYPALRDDLLPYLATLPTKEQADIWKAAAESRPAAFVADFEDLLTGKSKPLREIAAGALAQIANPNIVSRAASMLTTGKLDHKLGAVALLAKIGDDPSVAVLKSALASEQNDKVRAAIHEGLEDFLKVEAFMSPQTSAATADAAQSLADLEASFAKQAAKLKLPAASWLKADTLPPLFATDGSELSKPAIAFLLSKQSKHKTIDAAPDTLPLLAHIDRIKSASFGLALVEGFLNSDQAAADRWAPTLGGLLGDNRIIPPLLSRINDWCENSRHKLAEYSAQAISLLPGNEPLMVLDALANRYRSKFKNVGKACADAFAAAAAARGITPDELGDMVVPDFGFDAEGIRLFEWEGGKANAELGPDFKLSWSDPDSDKSWKALPASASEEVKSDVKTLTKLLKEALKGQTARLEMTLVRQRRWPVSRWRELYENHPLLRSFASSLVWGIYDASGTLLRSFRRYPNGLLANAAGDLEELPETDTMIGMVHPLELDATALDAWRAHLARFKVKQPFPQIDRPVELLDPLHGNRREITLTSGKQVGAGNFKSRSEKRGWVRGSVIDAGGISSIYKPFPGAGYEAILPTDNYWIGIDPMDSVELESAYFVKAESVGRGSYTYDEPNKDDPRVLRFDQVPAVVFSETMADLKAIIGTSAD